MPAAGRTRPRFRRIEEATCLDLEEANDLPDLEMLIAVTDAGGAPVLAPGPVAQGPLCPVLRRAPESALLTGIRRAADTTYAAQALRLDRFARNLVQLSGPVWLYLSEEEGGFARHGFWLEDDHGGRCFLETPYIDMVVDEAGLERGFFEKIFPHELAHTTLRLLVGDITRGPARKSHQSMTVMDYPTALDEGWAEHTELLVTDRTDNPWLLGRERGRNPDFLSAWVNKVDEALRTDGVRRNIYVHTKALPAAALAPNPDPFAVWLEGEVDATFLADELKPAQAMLSAEGVGATLFYRIVTSQALRERYEEPDFYARFGAVPGEVTPHENINLKLFAAMREMARSPLDPHRPHLLDLVSTYMALFPADAPAICEIFLDVTWGATASRDVAAALEALAYQGRVGDLAAFRSGVAEGIKLLDQLKADVVAGRVALDANVGPEIWLLNEAFLVPRRFFRPYDRNVPATFNLNAAAEPELMTLPGVDLALARRIVAARRELGFFRSVDDLSTISGVTDSLIGTLHRMQQAMAAADLSDRI
ncbi:MAG: hypothetical protein K0R39_3649 [Symbiobacteriaceae bacterium]|jgi:hypothetical protein|nr:hypothetical protein [Symbiobacteriaceae bacterium]